MTQALSHPCDICESRNAKIVDGFGRVMSCFMTWMSQGYDRMIQGDADRGRLPEERPRGHWVQTERRAHEAWAGLVRSSPRAAELLHLLVAQMGQHNAVVISQGTLATMMGRNRRTVMRAVEVLAEGNWLRALQIGDRGTVNAYVVNDQVAWQGKREGMRYSLFSASVVIAEAEQAAEALARLSEPLKAIPSLFPGERQLPTGEGLPPPSEPDLPGMEPDLPTRPATK